MNYLNTKTLITNNLTLKAISLIMGYTFWFIWSQTQTTSYSLDVPLCVYNIPESAQLEAPETVSIQIAGKLQDIYHLDLDNLAIHIDGATLHKGKNQCVVKNEQLFVPDTIKMIHYAPSNILISYNDNTPPVTLDFTPPATLAHVDEPFKIQDEAIIS